VEQWIYSLGVSHVSHLVPLEKEMPIQTKDTCSHTSSKESENANQVSSSLKMLKESSVQNYQETDGETQKEHQFCCMSSENWKEWVTKQRQEYSLRVKSEHLIREKESLSWGTPNTMDGLPSRSYEAMKRQATNGGRKNRQRPGNLREQVDPLMCQAYQEASAEANWPTMTAMEADKAGYYNKGQMGQSLSAMAKRGELSWPTARTSDAEGGAIETEMTQEGFRSKRHNSNQFFGAKLRDAVETHEKLCGPQDQDNHNTDGNRQGSWPTPCPAHVRNHDEPIENYYKRVKDYQEGKTKGKPGKSLGVAARELWPTPDTTQANDGVPWEKFKKDMDARRQRVKEAGLNGSGRSPNLCAAVQNPKWATPQASDYVEGRRTDLDSNQKCLGRDMKKLNTNQSMRLNPRWVETLMGLPVGWCLPSCTQPVTPEMMNSVYSEME
jgi:hypothetical protein